MARKDSKEARHHHFFSLRGKKKESRVKKGLGEALGAIGLRPEDDGKCGCGAVLVSIHWEHVAQSPYMLHHARSKKVCGLTTFRTFSSNSQQRLEQLNGPRQPQTPSLTRFPQVY